MALATAARQTDRHGRAWGPSTLPANGSLASPAPRPFARRRDRSPLYTSPAHAPREDVVVQDESPATLGLPRSVAKRVLRRSTSVARRGGLITGSSFYVGMIPTMAMIYCEQLIVVLRIAAAYGRDPVDPARAAEVLVVQGRYPTVQDAAAALQEAGAAAESRRSVPEVRTFFDVVRQLPSMIGLRLRQYTLSPIDLVIAGAEVASYLIPVVSMPVWTYASARATRRLGHAAIDFYSQPVPEQTLKSSIVLPPRPEPKTRKLLHRERGAVGADLRYLVLVPPPRPVSSRPSLGRSRH